MIKKCKTCKQPLFRREKERSNDWKLRKFCNQKCYQFYAKINPNKGTFQKGNHPKTEFKKGNPPPKHKIGCDCLRCFPKFNKEHPNWKGDEAGYSALHMWVRQELGQPEQCSHCEVKGKMNGRMWSIHYANISREYKRDVSDWIALCRRCHKKYDDDFNQLSDK